MRAQRLGNLQTVGLRGLAGKAISDGAFARRVYGGSAYEEADLRRVAAAVRGRDYPRSELVSALRTQNESWGCTPETRKALRRLEDGALCVITGQQAGILTGPLYTVYKALSAVAWARALESLLGEAVVPVFWIAGDDHDYEEVAHVAVPGRTGLPHHLELPRSLVSGAPSARVAELRFVGEIAGWADQTVSLLPDGPARDQVVCGIREAFAPGATFVDAFARLMVTWLGRYGL
ncbi:MAG TPA: bacillithiol biosynthesis BshC, partial [Candidatus Latescibacteria bacterium]|nr:bacillithiol biosynthesis BshC [Candidatus Latescibacterota bacterium]